MQIFFNKQTYFSLNKMKATYKKERKKHTTQQKTADFYTVKQATLWWALHRSRKRQLLTVLKATVRWRGGPLGTWPCSELYSVMNADPTQHTQVQSNPETADMTRVLFAAGGSSKGSRNNTKEQFYKRKKQPNKQTTMYKRTALN